MLNGLLEKAAKQKLSWLREELFIFLSEKKFLILLVYPGFSPWPSLSGIHSTRDISHAPDLVPITLHTVNAWSCTSHQAIPLSLEPAFLTISLDIFRHLNPKCPKLNIFFLKPFLLLECKCDGRNICTES